MGSKHGRNLELERHHAGKKKREGNHVHTGFINTSKAYAIDAVLADMLPSPLQKLWRSSRSSSQFRAT